MRSASCEAEHFFKMVDLPQPTLLDYILCLSIFLLTALPYLNSLEGNMVCCRACGAQQCKFQGSLAHQTLQYNCASPHTLPTLFFPSALPALPVL